MALPAESNSNTRSAYARTNSMRRAAGRTVTNRKTGSALEEETTIKKFRSATA